MTRRKICARQQVITFAKIPEVNLFVAHSHEDYSY